MKKYILYYLLLLMFLLFLIILFIAGCSAYKDTRIAKAVDMDLVCIGMTQVEVEEVIGIDYNLFEDEYYSDRYCTRWRIDGGYRGKRVTKTYFFEFDTLGKLTNWGWQQREKRGLW